jgi:hypothetical protein
MDELVIDPIARDNTPYTRTITTVCEINILEIMEYL